MMATYRQGDPGYSEAAARWRRQWRPAPTQGKEAIRFDQAHGYGASWDASPPAAGGRPADPAEALAAVANLDPLERWADVQGLGPMLDVEAARLTAWQLSQPIPDPNAPLPISQAEQACRAAQSADVLRRWRS